MGQPITNHTPGPWAVAETPYFGEIEKLKGEPAPDEALRWFRYNDGGFAVKGPECNICQVSFMFDGKVKRGEAWRTPDPVGLANARLIAAAPEMLSALEALTRTYCDIGFDDGEDAAKAWSLARAAIAKATALPIGGE